MSIAIMQFLSAGERPIREKTHARDAGLQPGDGRLANAHGFVDRFHGQAYALLALKAQVACRLEDAAGVYGLDLLGHVMLLSQSRTSRALMQPSKQRGSVGLLRPVHEQIYCRPAHTKCCATPRSVGIPSGLTEIPSADTLGVTFLLRLFGPDAVRQTTRFGFDLAREPAA